jgi:hypothetical protein
MSAYQKMAGTSAVFLLSDHLKSSPVERDGLTWSAQELRVDKIPKNGEQKSAMANVLALEGLEEYDPPENGDVRFVESIGECFIYSDLIRGWVQSV